MKAFSEDVDDLFDNACSMADVNHWIAERLMYAKCQKTKHWTKYPLVNVSNADLQNNINPVNYEPIDFDTGLTQGSVDTVFEFIEGKADNYYTETPITCDSDDEVQIQNIEEESITVDSQDELDLWEPEQIPDTPTRLADGQILEEFMLEEETDFQGIDECKIVDVQDELEIKECVDSKIVGMPNIPVKVAYEQEECIKEEISDVPTQIHAEQEISLPDRTIDQCKTEQEMSNLSQNIPGKLIPKLHTRCRKVLGSKLVRRVNPTRMVRRIIPSMCRPPP